MSLFINLTTNWFFAVPAYYERILGYITSGLLLIDFIVAFLVSPIRQSLGLLDLSLIAWVCLNSLFNSLIGYWVEEGKHYQEIRLTGRIENAKP